jgi:hypothetical protein
MVGDAVGIENVTQRFHHSLDIALSIDSHQQRFQRRIVTKHPGGFKPGVGRCPRLLWDIRIDDLRPGHSLSQVTAYQMQHYFITRGRGAGKTRQ